MTETIQVLSMLDEIRTIAQNGLEHSDDPYETRRYEQILDIVSEYYGETLEMPAEEARGRLREEFGHVTPKVGAAAVVFDEDDRVLLMRRTDTDLWCLPSGMTDPGESIRETATRETKEETGLDVEIDQLVGLYESPPGINGPHHFLGVAYRCSITGGERELSHEGDELRYWDHEEVPNWFSDHEEVVRDAYALRE